MSTSLFAPVCAIAPTRRRRFLWAAWWTSAPTRKPFRKPDAFAGGARTRAEALNAAERAAKCKLTELESSWARAWSNILMGKEPWPATTNAASDRVEEAPRARATESATSLWQILGVSSAATLAEIKRAYRARALQTHPDRGGNPEEFRALQRAYESALKRRKHAPKGR
ncbi:MAG TPA: J domain-containing protein [Polyangiaceae bacterium]|nr:J domain-containing protein [Polyangiaceae bacterium]